MRTIAKLFASLAVLLSTLLSLSLTVPLPPRTPAAAAKEQPPPLINADHRLEQDYAPEDLETLPGSSIQLSEQAVEPYIRMMDAMRADGVRPPWAVSGYRSYARQQYLHSSRTANRVAQGMNYQAAYAKTSRTTAPPGASEHQAGLAVDVSTTGGLTTAFGNTKQGVWLQEHSWEYGFVVRYAADKSDLTGIDSEPWHLRYVGDAHAKAMVENNWCLEEYIDQLQAKNG